MGSVVLSVLLLCVCYFIRILVQVWVWWYNILLWWPFSYIGHSLTFSKSKFRFTKVSLCKSDVRLRGYKDNFIAEVSYVVLLLDLVKCVFRIG